MTAQDRILKGTDLATGPYILGTMDFGEKIAPETAAQIVQTAREAGITMYDTSNHYVNGTSEEVLGEIVKPFRDDILITTKAGSQGGEHPLGAEVIRAEVEKSLARLQTDRIDLYLLHRPDWSTPIEETLGVLHELVAEGKIRHLGQSNYAAWQIADFIHRSGDKPAPIVSQQSYNMLARRLEEEYAACAQAFGVPTVVYNPLAGGLLSGKYDLNVERSGTRFEKSWWNNTYWNEPHFAAVEKFKGIADSAGWTPAELALRWVKNQPLVDAVLFGATSVAQLQENLRILDGPAPSADMLEAIDEVWFSTLRGPAMGYNR
ncbi:aldo/keto reductase [Ruania rhizosphaerae]|uniref:aldo/keto reductase n=1 Tax=Ruania rhizosphaerae TaxID=1840413 RepID=UPI001358318C|nr:aldo/keto reductase [Ruania rhizosphaerae]